MPISLANPVFFYLFIAVLLAVSLLAIFSMQEDGRKNLKKQDEALKSAVSRAEELEKDLGDKEAAHKKVLALLEKALEEKEELRKELALSNQMYNGLKGQYDELDEKFTQLSDESMKARETKKAGLPAAEPPPVVLPRIPNFRNTVQQDGEEPKTP